MCVDTVEKDDLSPIAALTRTPAAANLWSNPTLPKPARSVISHRPRMSEGAEAAERRSATSSTKAVPPVCSRSRVSGRSRVSAALVDTPLWLPTIDGCKEWNRVF